MAALQAGVSSAARHPRANDSDKRSPVPRAGGGLSPNSLNPLKLPKINLIALVFEPLSQFQELLAERVKRRTASRFDEWAEETRALLADGYAEDCPGLKTLGYPQMLDYLAGRLSRADAIHQIVAASMAYAKRQNTWFGRYRNALRIELEKPEDYAPAALAARIIEA
jgi:tRNA A37 N6-isopentenylltransferase MiaA